jgi:hypothetical protein
MTPKLLWSIVRHCFELDDGSLPTLELKGLSPDDLGALYLTIRRQSRVVSEEASFWDLQAHVDRGLDDVPNAALLVATGQAAPFHFVVEGMAAEDRQVPCLGIHIFKETIAIDYRMGSEWGPEQVFTLFQILEALKRSTVNGVLVQSGVEFPDAAAFAQAWRLFLKRVRS